MSDNPVLMLFLPVALAVVMAGLGLHLTLADFRRVLAVPRAVAVALAVLVLLLPPEAFVLAKAFGLPGELVEPGVQRSLGTGILDQRDAGALDCRKPDGAVGGRQVDPAGPGCDTTCGCAAPHRGRV